jgi:hypothetical protein
MGATMTCQDCGFEFDLDDWNDAKEFGQAVDEHVQQHHQALFAVVAHQEDDDAEI